MGASPWHGYRIDAGAWAKLDEQRPLPPVPYVAIVRGDPRSALVGSVIMLAQSCCDFARVLPVEVDVGSM